MGIQATDLPVGHTWPDNRATSGVHNCLRFCCGALAAKRHHARADSSKRVLWCNLVWDVRSRFDCAPLSCLKDPNAYPTAEHAKYRSRE